MNTTYRLFSQEILDDFMAMLREWPNSYYEIDGAEYAISPFVTFYFKYESERYLNVSETMIKVHEDFERLLGYPYKVATHPDSERPHPYDSKRLGDLRQWAQKTQCGKSFEFNFTDENNHRSSPATAGYFWRDASRAWSEDNYSYLQFYYRWQWWLDNQDVWRRFVCDTIERLGPEQVYSGFAMANPLEFGARSEVAVWDRALTPYFYGLDTDYPFGMHLTPDLPSGLRPPTWGFFLSDLWREKLSLERDAVRAVLVDPRIRIDDLNCGQWIELGAQPELYPVEDGVPELPILLNQLLRPLRHSKLDLLGFGEWDGDPNERFTLADSQRWLARFDEDSDWPTPQIRGRAPDAPRIEPAASHVIGGEPCPLTGWWRTTAKHDTREHFDQGEVMPSFHTDTLHGLTLWQWDTDQREPSAMPQEPARIANSGDPAPRTGQWQEVGNPSVLFCAHDLGDPLPVHQERSVSWQWIEAPTPGLRANSGQPCPYPGVWSCEDWPTGEQTFMHGVSMPQVGGRSVTWKLVRGI